MAAGLLMAANASKIMIDGKDVPGVDSLDFKITRNRQNIHTISSEERIGAYFGALQVTGSLKVKSAFDHLDKKMYETIPKVASFQIVIELYPQSSDKGVKKITFDECMLEDKSFGMNVNGVAVTTYNFSSTRIREE
jgi:predicted ester cyclase